MKCQKKGKSRKKWLVVKPTISSEMNFCYQVDVINMQAQHGGNYLFILVYQDLLIQCVTWTINKQKKLPILLEGR